MCRVEMKQWSFNLWMALWSDVMMDRCRDARWFSACPNFPSLPHSEVLPYLSCRWPRADSELPAGTWLRTHGGRSYKETTASLSELPFLLSFPCLDVPGFSDWLACDFSDPLISSSGPSCPSHNWSNSFFFFLNYLFILFLAVLGLCFCARAFSSCGERGPLFITVRGPLTIVASLVVEHRLQMRRLSSCGSRA